MNLDEKTLKKAKKEFRKKFPRIPMVQLDWEFWDNVPIIEEKILSWGPSEMLSEESSALLFPKGDIPKTITVINENKETRDFTYYFTVFQDKHYFDIFGWLYLDENATLLFIEND